MPYTRPVWIKEAVTVLVMGHESILQVRDPARIDNPVWKFPGGNVYYQESPLTAACRETYEETGVVICEGDLLLLDTEERHSTDEPHLHYFFGVQITKTFNDMGLQDFGPITGEQTRLIPKDTPFTQLELSTQREILKKLWESQK